METREGNKLIAEFFGLKRGWWISQQKPLTDDKKQWCDLDGKTFLGSRAYYDKDLRFHESWDWLMPVVEKIHTVNTTGISLSYKIEEQYSTVISFIKYYNSKNK